MDTKIVLDFLEKLGQKISTTGQQVFGIYTHQAYANGITDLVISFIALITVVGSIIFTYKMYHKFDKYIEKYNERGFGEDFVWAIGLSGAVGVIALIIFGVFISVGIKEVINPEYYAIKNLIQDLSSGIK